MSHSPAFNPFNPGRQVHKYQFFVCASPTSVVSFVGPKAFKMPYAASIQSTTGTIVTYARKMMVQNGRPEMEIILDDHTDGKIYTTYDALSGRVKITSAHNARFDEVQITLEGSTKTWVENLSPHSTRARTTARHNFLKMTMPIPESEYPQPRIAEAGRTYTFPFNFVVPAHLLDRACSHNGAAPHVHYAHTRLPPSMGDRELSGKDDLCPAMAHIMYCIKVRVIRHQEQKDGMDLLVEGLKRLQIVPALLEQPPMSIGDNAGQDYRLAKTKTLRKGVFSGKLGKIHVSAAQPSALVLPAPSSGSSTAPTITATVNLRFDPNDKSSQPPKLGGLTTKIKSTTFFAARPNMEFPSHFSMIQQYEMTRGVYDASTSLSSRCVESVSWSKQKSAPEYTRRNSNSSSSSSDYSDEGPAPEPKEGSDYYTAQILVPITLPTSKTWVPTFHSCIASRVYTIDMALTIHTPGTGVPATTVNLHLPVQIAVTGNVSSRAPMTPAEAAAMLAEAETYFRPRIIEAPNPELVGNSVLVDRGLPPSYEDFAISQQPSQQVVDASRC